MIISIASDHAGFGQKQEIARHLRERGKQVIDRGPDGSSRVDYPDYAEKVALDVAAGDADLGVLVCGTGIGMAIAANKVCGIRAANVTRADFAALSREHNDANLITLSGRYVTLEENIGIVDEFIGAGFAGGRHEGRIGKIMSLEGRMPKIRRRLGELRESDPQIANAIEDELDRERNTIELIASENFPSPAVNEAVGSILTNKYAEGYPGRRYYGGCEHVDVVESIAVKRACELFGSSFANVQPHSGAQANFAAYQALAEPGDTIMGMSLQTGGHLTHGSPVNFSGIIYRIVPYGVDLETEMIDYDEVARIAYEVHPKIIVAGASAYPRIIDFERMSQIAKEAGAYLMVDMAHIAGLVAGGMHPSPVPFADVVTSTSHKTLRGPRGGFILSNDEEIASKVDKAIFPGSQGGPLMHVIAGKAVAFGEAMSETFKMYAESVVRNCARLADGLSEGGLRLVSGGTDNHMCLVDLTSTGVTGKEAERLLEGVGITANKNTIPNEQRSPFVASGIRLGTAACTSRGFSEEDFHEVGGAVAKALFNAEDAAALFEVARTTRRLLDAHPLYPGLEY